MQQSKSLFLKKCKIILLSSLASGNILLPTVLFSALAEQQSGYVDFLQPTIVVYTVQRVFLIALRGFGEIKNPRKIMKAGMLSALLGAVCVLAALVYRPLLLIGALLVGIGLSPVASMYAPLRLEMAEKGYPVNGTDGWGAGVSLVLALIMLFTRKSAFPVVQTVFLLYIACAVYSLGSLNTDEFFQGCPAIDTQKRKPVFLFFAVLVFLLLMVLRQYRVSGIPALIYVAPAVVIIGLVVEACRHRNYSASVWRIYWTGGMGSILLIFSLIYWNNAGTAYNSMLCYVMLLLAKVLPLLLAKPIMKRLRGKPVSGPCTILSAGFAFLLLVPVPAVFYAGILLSACFANLAEAEDGRAYMQTERHPLKERALAKNRVNSIGKCLAQMLLFISIRFVEKYHTHTGLIKGTSEIPESEATAALRIVCLVCCCTMLVCAVLISVLTKNKKRSGNEALADA